mmetsp:Transcript_29277/g.38485  ORF Transcript_29277/g.38485 Transcript_29277/m.38485 type:complete len:439 (-) Transcript_29277:135-1451(-)
MSRASPAKKGRATRSQELKVGRRIDALDLEQVWSPATIVEVGEDSKVLIKYDGWGSEWNEWVDPEKQRHRIAKVYEFTHLSKCWVKVASQPWWPAMVTVRRPMSGSTEGQEALRLEEKTYVQLFAPPAKYLDSGLWLQTSKISPWMYRYDKRKEAVKTSKFQKAIQEAERSNVASLPLVYQEGTLLAGDANDASEGKEKSTSERKEKKDKRSKEKGSKRSSKKVKINKEKPVIPDTLGSKKGPLGTEEPQRGVDKWRDGQYTATFFYANGPPQKVRGGVYSSIKEAALCYDRIAYSILGKTAELNYPSNPQHLELLPEDSRIPTLVPFNQSQQLQPHQGKKRKLNEVQSSKAANSANNKKKKLYSSSTDNEIQISDETAYGSLKSSAKSSKPSRKFSIEQILDILGIGPIKDPRYRNHGEKKVVISKRKSTPFKFQHP